MRVVPKKRLILNIPVTCIYWMIEVNAHTICYSSADEYEYDDDIIEGLDLSKDIYYLRIYPHTPVGFVDFGANSLDELHHKLYKWVNE